MSRCGVLPASRSRPDKHRTGPHHLSTSLSSPDHDRTDTDVRTWARDTFSYTWQYVSDKGQCLDLPGELQMFVTHVEPIPSCHIGNVIGFAAHIAPKEIGILPIHARLRIARS